MVTHTRDRCIGTACPIHHPSEHHMNKWPVTLRAFGLAERQCDHGVGHPDPDSIAYLKTVRPDIPFGIHGCDGCCVTAGKNPFDEETPPRKRVKVLFLDVDGVLNSAEWFASQVPPVDMATCDPKAVKRVLNVLEETGAALVLSSTWRNYPDLYDKLKTEYGLPIADVTPDLGEGVDGHRGVEIGAWLEVHPEVDQYAIIDDDTDAGHGLNVTHFVRTHWKYGMYGKHERLLKEMLR